jgi:hypothetical protein
MANVLSEDKQQQVIASGRLGGWLRRIEQAASAMLPASVLIANRLGIRLHP